MKIKVFNENHQPLMNTSVKLQVKGRDSGMIYLTTSTTGELDLDDKYQGQQIAVATNTTTGQWTTAHDGASLIATQKETTESFR